jgi:hypothetical protein
MDYRSGTEETERHDEHCPTCGRFVPGEESEGLGDAYFDLPPGGFQSHDYLVVYCNAACGDAKSPRAYYEDDADYNVAWAAR